MTPQPAGIPSYAELRCLSNFSFLRGASKPEELVERAQALGYTALALTDECSLAGIVRAHVAAKKQGLKLLVGSQFQVQSDAPFTLVVLATNLNGYGNLCEFITRLRRTAPKGTYRLTLKHISADALADCLVIAVPQRGSAQAQTDSVARWLLLHFLGRCWLGVEQLRLMDDEMRLHRLRQSSELTAVPLVAVGDVHMHLRSRKALQDVLTATRIGKPLTACGHALAPNAEQRLRSRLELAQCYPEALLAETLKIAERCAFSLDELCYQYPSEVVPPGETPASYLRRLTDEGMGKRWPAGTSDKVRQQVEHELALITELRYEHYFLTVYDIVAFARSQHILCQGRGSAANSAVCYCLGITEVDPARASVLFERFISRERNEPPDIDVDFEHERREEVIQYIYEKYGRDHAGLTATVITYRTKSAFRDVGKAMGLSEDAIQALQGSSWGHFWGKPTESERAKKETARLVEAGIDPTDATIRQILDLVRQIKHFPRHLSQHTGGFVITKMPLDTVVPIENAAMEGRTVIEWDKDDLDALGIFKIDVLALGMLTCIHKAFDLIEGYFGRTLTLATVPQEDPETYAMLQEADSIGVFQVESRAQMNMLPRLRPAKFYDLVIEVAIVRPGPIQGGMVHPYLRRRTKQEPVEFPKPELEAVLGRTLGVPLFQEQAMKIAMVAAGFSAAEADKLRRSMASFRRNGQIEQFRQKLIEGMVRNGYERPFAERCFSQIEGFGEYGFPESHAASFAKLVYVSAWLKCHYPAAFAAALLNSQPMGFYAPAQIVRDARQHGVEVRPIDVNHSEWDCTLETADATAPAPDLPPIGNPAWRVPDDRRMALRLGFREIKGLGQGDADTIVERRERRYGSIAEIKARVRPRTGVLERLARADAFASLRIDRRRALWAAKGVDDWAPLPLFGDLPDDRLRPEPEVTLPEISLGEQVADDYRMLKMSLKAHPMNLLRGSFEVEGTLPCGVLTQCPDGARVRVAGLVLIRQRPGEGNAIFITLEDETGIANLIVWPHKMERYRRVVLGASLICVEGKLQREGIVTHIISERLYDMTHRLGYLVKGARADGIDPDAVDPRASKRRLIPASRDFH